MNLADDLAPPNDGQSRYFIVVDLRPNSLYEPMPHEIIKALREANPSIIWPSSLNDDWCMAITKWKVYQYTPDQAG